MTGHFGRRLRRLRGERSQREVAEALQIPTTTFSSLEQQETVPRGPILKKLMEHFNVSIDYFYPPERQVSEAAREWLRERRRTTFTGAPTIATHTDDDFAPEVKTRIAERVRLRLETKDQ